MKDGPRLIFAEFHLQRTFLRHTSNHRWIGFARLYGSRRGTKNLYLYKQPTWLGKPCRANLIFRPKVTGGCTAAPLKAT